ncbi:DinB family protein [Promicromonospora sp. MEB111]|uniref:DinB family protein n=1 Tax=Promicromonospora sp. MEB111 TaxID=3040301 RepID=UPI00254E4DF8|nr:DinB family protein [Promicromonospora sp. MEB111]
MTTITDPADRFDIPFTADEKQTLLGILAFQRDTLRWKVSGLSSTLLAYRHAPSTLSLGGLLKHLAVIEAAWVNVTFAGTVETPTWYAQYKEQEGRNDWTFSTAADDSPEQLLAWLDEAQRTTEQIVAETADLDTIAQEKFWDGQEATLRWILLHLIQEYARHLGHADLLREAIDGSVGI